MTMSDVYCRVNRARGMEVHRNIYICHFYSTLFRPIHCVIHNCLCIAHIHCLYHCIRVLMRRILSAEHVRVKKADYKPDTWDLDLYVLLFQLLSPDDLVSACKLLESLALPIRMRVFESGVMVLQLATHSEEQMIKLTSQAVSVE